MAGFPPRKPRVRPPSGRAARPWTGLLASELGKLAHAPLLFLFGLSPRTSQTHLQS